MSLITLKPWARLLHAVYTGFAGHRVDSERIGGAGIEQAAHRNVPLAAIQVQHRGLQPAADGGSLFSDRLQPASGGARVLQLACQPLQHLPRGPHAFRSGLDQWRAFTISAPASLAKFQDPAFPGQLSLLKGAGWPSGLQCQPVGVNEQLEFCLGQGKHFLFDADQVRVV
ncbi:MAG TPA: hypothetical protein EYP90_01275 [Chromatiaceae bacterium]|nr:hypothetical protein [Chromatiaceae bacterium]